MQPNTIYEQLGYRFENESFTTVQGLKLKKSLLILTEQVLTNFKKRIFIIRPNNALYWKQRSNICPLRGYYLETEDKGCSNI